MFCEENVSKLIRKSWMGGTGRFVSTQMGLLPGWTGALDSLGLENISVALKM